MREGPKFDPMVHVQKRLAELKKRQKQEAQFGATLDETFERADTRINPLAEERE